jgi:hypothetical protein
MRPEHYPTRLSARNGTVRASGLTTALASFAFAITSVTISTVAI